jgi:hypothetical protein
MLFTSRTFRYACNVSSAVRQTVQPVFAVHIRIPMPQNVCLGWAAWNSIRFPNGCPHVWILWGTCLSGCNPMQRLLIPRHALRLSDLTGPEIVCHHPHHLQGLSLLLQSILEHEASLRIMSSSFSSSRWPLYCNNLFEDRGFLHLDRLSAMASESCPSATKPWEGSLSTEPAGPGARIG